MSKKHQDKDPHAEREAAKYEKPIASREYIMQLLDQAGRPMGRDSIAESLGIDNEEDYEALRRRLRAMERDGQLIFNRRREYGLISKMNLISGRVMGHPDGFGFLIPEDGSDDLFLSARQMRGLLHGDKALVHVTGLDHKGRREAAVVEVLERANQEVIGRLFIEGGVGFVIADNKRINQDILVPSENFAGAKHGQIVSVAIVEQPTMQRQAIGKVVEVLGEHMAPGMEIDIAIRSHGLPCVWPPAVEDEISHYTGEVPEQAKQGRVDLRDTPLVTIDGEDARDFDDAVYCESTAKGWRLLVAIADVSHYVKPETALDHEAQARGTSVYFPERVIPMLPEVLSNGLCSLNPEVDRLCMVCEMHLSSKGKVERYRFFDAVMRSHARLTYNKVAKILIDQDEELRQQYHQLLPQLLEMHRLFKVLHKRRAARGAIDFDTTETKIIFGEQRKIDRIVALQRNDAHRLIEEFMILANVSAALFLQEHRIPALYRVHDSPKQEKVEALRQFLAEFGLSLEGGDKPEPLDYAQLLQQIAERPDAHLIQTVMLRSLQQAVYTPNNTGHFGLAHEAYAHFTSPIRRYPDLLVHRAIRHLLQGGSAKNYHYTPNTMYSLGEHCSQTERRADEATRDAVDWLKCEFMMDKVGEIFAGTISSVTSFGLFIELDDIYVEGLVHVTALDNDYYQFDQVHHRLVGERTRQMYRLSDRVEVKVARVDLDERKIDFDLIRSLRESEQPEQSPRGKSTKGKQVWKQSDSEQATSSKRRKNKKSSRQQPAKKKSAKKKTARKKKSGSKRR